MPMSLEIKVKENEKGLSLEKIEVVKALEVLQKRLHQTFRCLW